MPEGFEAAGSNPAAHQTPDMSTPPYTCNDYRLEMQLNGLLRRLATEALTPEQRLQLERDIQSLRQSMGLTDGPDRP